MSFTKAFQPFGSETELQRPFVRKEGKAIKDQIRQISKQELAFFIPITKIRIVFDEKDTKNEDNNSITGRRYQKCNVPKILLVFNMKIPPGSN